jgi:S1-C subfamily serine protease
MAWRVVPVGSRPGGQPEEDPSHPEGSPFTRRLLFSALLVFLGLVAAGVALLHADQRASRRAVSELTMRLDTEPMRRETLERDLADHGRRLARYQDHLQDLVNTPRRRLAVLARTVDTLNAERRAGERIIRAHGPGVALIQGVVVYQDGAGRPARYRGVEGRSRERAPLDWLGLTTEGEGPVARTTFLGTGFLVSRDGALVTSRHVARPWDGDQELVTLLEQRGLSPRVTQLRAFFPGLRDPVALTPVKVSDTADLVVLRGTVPRSVPIVPLDRSGLDAVPGRPVIVLGYPAGLQLLLARVDPALLETLIDKDVREIADDTVDIPALLERLSQLKQIQPYVTWGHLADARPHQLAHDAGTATGGSGGPIFATSGRVIGVSTAVVRGVGGAAIGAPIRSALPLVGAGGRPDTGVRGK